MKAIRTLLLLTLAAGSASAGAQSKYDEEWTALATCSR